MLTLNITLAESYNEENDTFNSETVVMRMEHSLLALAKWEFIYEKPFLSSDKTDDELFTYFKCMALEEYPDEYYEALTFEHIQAVNDYCSKKGTATWFNEEPENTRQTSEVVTAELVYYWMLSNNIPKDFETWYIHRLLTLIRVFSVKNSPPKKISQDKLREKYRLLNEQRLARLKTKG